MFKIKKVIPGIALDPMRAMEVGSSHEEINRLPDLIHMQHDTTVLANLTSAVFSIKAQEQQKQRRGKVVGAAMTAGTMFLDDAATKPVQDFQSRPRRRRRRRTARNRYDDDGSTHGNVIDTTSREMLALYMSASDNLFLLGQGLHRDHENTEIPYRNSSKEMLVQCTNASNNLFLANGSI